MKVIKRCYITFNTGNTDSYSKHILNKHVYKLGTKIYIYAQDVLLHSLYYI